MVMTLDQGTNALAGRRTGDGVVIEVDRTPEFHKARRRTRIVRSLRVLLPVGVVSLLGLYGLSIAVTAGLVGNNTLQEIAIRKILPEDLTMKNPRYEGFGKDGSSYVFTAKSAEQDFTVPGVVKLNSIVGEIYQADKTRTDVTATRGVFDNEKSVLDLFEEINVDSQSGLKARLTQATILTKEDLLTSDQPVLVEFPNGSVRSKQMRLRQKAREATFVEEVAVTLTPPQDEKKPPQEASTQSAEGALFTPSNGPINIDANRLDIDDTGKRAIFTGNVRAQQTGSNMTTPELEVFYEGEGMMGGAGASAPATPAAASQAGKLKRIVAKKPVVMKRENGDVVTSDTAEFDAIAQTALLMGEVIMTSGTDRRASSNRVEIDEASGAIVLAGAVVVTQGNNQLQGGRLAIDRNGGTAKMTTPPEAGLGPGRIAARLVRGPDSKGGAKKKSSSDADESKFENPLGSFKTDPSAPVDLTADSLDVDDKKKVAIFRGDVDASQDTFKIRCAELSAFYKGEASLVDAANPGASASGEKKGAELSRIEARRDVHVTSKDGQSATGDWADFDTKTNKITMGGNVVLSKGKSMIRGTRLLIDLTSGESKIDTAPQNTVAAPSGGGWVTRPSQEGGKVEGQGRASAVFFPQELQEDQAAAKKKGKAPAPGTATDSWSATATPGASGEPAN
jgi:LPS export ABC transporter protein LptC/lipopolysaccharide transport protein LptA